MFNIRIIGVPMDLGADRRGVDMGPSAIRNARLQASLEELGHTVEDLGDIDVNIPESRLPGSGNLKFVTEIAEASHALANAVTGALDEGFLPLVLGGDHSIAIGSVAGVSTHFRKRDRLPVGLIWLDAHGDMNTPDTTPSGNIHGMSFAVCLGLGAPELLAISPLGPAVRLEHSVLVGARDLDPGERGVIRELGLKTFTMRDIDERGLRSVMAEAIAIASAGTVGFHLTVDMDFVDPRFAPGVGTPVRGGVTHREGHLAMEMVADSGRMVSFDVVEINPLLDIRNETGLLAADFALSAFGKQII